MQFFDILFRNRTAPQISILPNALLYAVTTYTFGRQARRHPTRHRLAM